MKTLEERVAAIEARNRRVTKEKQWERSWTRRIAIAVCTYIVICTFLIVIDDSRPFLTAFIPVTAFLLSTLALKGLRKIHIR
jgi:hypothetical protein